MSVTPQQELFAQHVASGRSQAEAYRLAYPKSRGWKPNAVWSQASQLMADRRLTVRVQELRNVAAARVTIDLARVLEEISRVAFVDVRRLFNADGSPRNIEDLDDATAAAIAGIEVVEQFEGSGESRRLVGYVKKYRLADKNAALEKLCRYFGAYEKDNRQRSDPLAALIASLSGRVVGAVSDPPGDEEDHAGNT